MAKLQEAAVIFEDLVDASVSTPCVLTCSPSLSRINTCELRQQNSDLNDVCFVMFFLLHLVFFCQCNQMVSFVRPSFNDLCVIAAYAICRCKYPVGELQHS